MESKNHLHEPIKIELKKHEIQARLVAEDGEIFTDANLYKQHCYKLNLEKLRAIHKPHFFKDQLHWFFLVVFIVGYLFGWFCNFTSS